MQVKKYINNSVIDAVGDIPPSLQQEAFKYLAGLKPETLQHAVDTIMRDPNNAESMQKAAGILAEGIAEKKDLPQNLETHTLRGGFTLVEVLVTIGVIGILMAVLLPAIASAVRAAHHTSMVNEMRQIGTAIQSKLSNDGEYPHAQKLEQEKVSGASVRRYFSSWAVNISPYLEGEPTITVRDYYDRNAPAAEPIDGGSGTIAGTGQPDQIRRMSYFAPYTNVKGGLDFMAIAGDAQPTVNPTEIIARQLWNKAYMKALSDPNLLKAEALSTVRETIFTGIMIPETLDAGDIKWKLNAVRPAEIYAGTSHVALLGEATTKARFEDGQEGQNPFYWKTHIGANWVTTGLGHGPASNTYPQLGLPESKDVQGLRPRSGYDTGTVTYVFADGHVESFSTNMDLGIIRDMGNRNRGGRE